MRNIHLSSHLHLFVILAVMAVFFTVINSVHAVEFEPYLRVGTINLNEDGINEGHKSLVAVGVKTRTGLDKLTGELTVEWWTMAEPLDEDIELPRKGYYVSGEIGYNFMYKDIDITPAAGVSYEYIKRHANESSPGSWEKLKSFSALLGVKVKKKIFYLKGGIIAPFLLRTDNDDPDAKIGFNAEAGIEYKRLTLGYFYKRIGFDENSENPEIDFNRYGVVIGFKF